MPDTLNGINPTGIKRTNTLAIEITTINQETWFRITNIDALRPFFMSVVSDSNHWMFISSNGGLTAGRKNSTYALFPYYTDDKITEAAAITGSKSIFQVKAGDQIQVWEPFCNRNSDSYRISRNLYKNIYGNKIMFEEVNHDLGLTFRYQWNSSNLYGFVRKATLQNHSGEAREVTLLDGLQNLMPYGVEPNMQIQASNLADAYKRSELMPESGLGIYALSAIIVDKAEPSEALKANVVWGIGLRNPGYLLSSLQLDRFRRMEVVQPESDIKGEKGAYFMMASLTLAEGAAHHWKIVANVNHDHAQVIDLSREIANGEGLDARLEQDIETGTRALRQLVSASDGLRLSADTLKDTRHYSNALFNIMRGGTFDQNYQIEKWDLSAYLKNASKTVFAQCKDRLDSLPDVFSLKTLTEWLSASNDPDLYRLVKEYLPLKFSRRHGDPSRPWNQFSINTRSEVDGSKILDYQGNWRDIFQNWEALVHSYPGFIEGMIFKFLNATTFDGYNPYRVTKDGFDWETIEPDNPWSYIGYWGDHQIIYLLKFLEFYRSRSSGGLNGLLANESFVYANVPYRIKPYRDIARDPKNTIDFDETSDHAIREKVAREGADGSLLVSAAAGIHHVNFLEKILATVLAKMSNFIPEGGIWMNTQRPEWNDANNALVGNGVSMVTLYYLRRFLSFFEEVLQRSNGAEVEVSEEMAVFFGRIAAILKDYEYLLVGPVSDSSRKEITDALGMAGSEYRTRIYEKGFTGRKVTLKVERVSQFTGVALKFLEHSIRANRRKDHLYHSYNLMSMTEKGIPIDYLSEMLEGQVAVLSSGYLSADEVVRVLDALRASALYRADQNSYMLYPNKELPGFLQKNSISEASVKRSALLQRLVTDGNRQVITRDVDGGYHFNGNFRNAADVRAGLDQLLTGPYAQLVREDGKTVLQIFEEVFNHKAFTGRSGTFYAYEGLGSIYWHMVSKLHLAVMEVCREAYRRAAPSDVLSRLATHFQQIGEGIGIHKAPEVYGAFPTDPYSHTPQHRGAQQPGMTGQVKEDILVSIGELGVDVVNGCLSFRPWLLRRAEFSPVAGNLDFIDIHQGSQIVQVPEQSLCFSVCQVPVIYRLADAVGAEVVLSDGRTVSFADSALDVSTSREIFERTGEVRQITVSIPEAWLQ
jgi:hypothetical protein